MQFYGDEMRKFINIDGKPTAAQIREALNMHRETLNRPEYSLMVQRELIESFRSGGDHYLKDEINKYFKNRAITRPGYTQANEKDQELIIAACENKALKRHLVAVSGYSMQFLQMVIDRKSSLSDLAARDLNQALPKAQKLYKTECEEQAKKLKKNICGYTACYRNGCRCVKCTNAYKRYRNKQAYLQKRRSQNQGVAA